MTQRDVLRILDANANRVREALRVMEDYARFGLADSELSGGLKTLRHDFRAALAKLPHGLLAVNRDTPNDVGTRITTPGESARISTGAVVVAAGKRLSEALRSMEEYGKTIDDAFALAVEALRYRGYELEKRLTLRLGAEVGGARRKVDWQLCVLLTEALCKQDWVEVLEATIAGGADCVQLREKNLPDGKLFGRATVVARHCRAAGIACVINDRVDIALLVGATGVHLGQSDLPAGQIQKLAGCDLVVGVSTTNIVQAEAAVLSGADYLGLGPMFPTTTKSGKDVAGVEFAGAYLARFELPHLAIGGIDSANIGTLLKAGVRGVAVCSAICGADDPQAATTQILELIAAVPAPNADLE